MDQPVTGRVDAVPHRVEQKDEEEASAPDKLMPAADQRLPTEEQPTSADAAASAEDAAVKKTTTCPGCKKQYQRDAARRHFLTTQCGPNTLSHYDPATMPASFRVPADQWAAMQMKARMEAFWKVYTLKRNPNAVRMDADRHLQVCQGCQRPFAGFVRTLKTALH